MTETTKQRLKTSHNKYISPLSSNKVSVTAIYRSSTMFADNILIEIEGKIISLPTDVANKLGKDLLNLTGE